MGWEEAWKLLLEGRHPADKSRRWQVAVRALQQRGGPRALLESWEQAGIKVLVEGFAGYPTALLADKARPLVLWAKGNPLCLGSPDERRPAVGIVGTRSATRYGLSVAAELGRELAERGVSVVSGLALGIDAAAHEGCLVASERAASKTAAEGKAASKRSTREGASRKPSVLAESGPEAPPAVSSLGKPIGVVATGVDVVYPRTNARTWERVAKAGLILSEAPPGTAPERWRFPVRNRLIAALSQVLVVVECHEAGGSLFTVDEALERGIQVMAVPGSIYSPASKGTNHLLADGAALVRSVDDVMIALALSVRDGPSQRGLSAATRSASGESISSRKGDLNASTRARQKRESRIAAATARRLALSKDADAVSSGQDRSGLLSQRGPAGSRSVGEQSCSSNLVTNGSDRSSHRAEGSTGSALSLEETSILAALGWEPVSLEGLSRATGLGIAEVALAVEQLVSSGLVVSSRGLVERA
jgi:DNA processing protein